MLNIEIGNHRLLGEMVYDEIKTKILKGEITPGIRMKALEMAEELGVSRTPISEALRKLEKEGLVEIEPRKGAYVSHISVKDMLDSLEVRQNIEGLAAYFAAKRMTEEEKGELERVSRKYNMAVEEGNTNEMIKQDTLFHYLIAEGSGNRVIVNMVGQLQEQVLRFRYLYYDGFKRGEKMPVKHDKIIKALRNKDQDNARDVAVAHVRKLNEMVQRDHKFIEEPVGRTNPKFSVNHIIGCKIS